MKFDLTFENPESDEFAVSKVCEALLVGDTPCVLLRSVSGSEFYPMTDDEGLEITYMGDNPSGVIFNGRIHNTARACLFKIVLDKDLIHADSKVDVTLSQGW